ncbi:SET domain-containing protein 5 [Tulasnella sp. JGI-2019a]|nr:SET domain-containing protein 5 [Tulasnella sp. JGI-2019a]
MWHCDTFTWILPFYFPIQSSLLLYRDHMAHPVNLPSHQQKRPTLSMTSTVASSISPSDQDVLTAVEAFRTKNPSLGVAKLQAAILSANPSWTLSEKRLRKILKPPAVVEGDVIDQNNGDRDTEASTPVKAAPVLFPKSKLNDDLDVEQWTKKVKVHVFGKAKGKGLVATEDIKEDEVLWREEPFVYSPTWDIQDAQTASERCALCALPLISSKFNPVGCGHECGSVWCSRLCASRSQFSHPFLCSVQNPAVAPLLTHIRANTWIALGAWTRIVALLLGEWVVASPNAKVGASKEWKVVRGLAAMSLRDRLKVLSNWEGVQHANGELWKTSYDLYVQAFDAPPDSAWAKKLAKLKKNKTLPNDIRKELFDFENFLVNLGRMSLNLEAHGAIYVLHSHLNHSCQPNVSVKHLEGPGQPGRITVIAKAPIGAGEELLVSYVNPEDDVQARRNKLKEWNFGECRCKMCVDEDKRRRKRKEVEKTVEGEGTIQAEALDGLEEDLRGAFGL